MSNLSPDKLLVPQSEIHGIITWFVFGILGGGEVDVVYVFPWEGNLAMGLQGTRTFSLISLPMPGRGKTGVNTTGSHCHTWSIWVRQSWAGEERKQPSVRSWQDHQ